MNIDTFLHDNIVYWKAFGVIQNLQLLILKVDYTGSEEKIKLKLYSNFNEILLY